MSIRNLHWYNANETRSYPLDDSAHAVAHNGLRLPSNILADLNLRYPQVLGRYPFLAAVVVTAKLVSITIQCASAPDDVTTFAPVAVFSAARSTVTPGRHYPLKGQYPGVGGWVVFGGGLADTSFTGRFAGPAAALLASRAAKAYSPLPVASMAKLYNDTPLTGIVSLRAEQPLTITKENREIDGILRDAIVVRLEQPTGPTDNLQLGAANVFTELSGPCGSRPESNNCGNQSPIEAINSVRPDCDGNITIEFRGCAEIAQVQEVCGVILDCGLGLSTACTPSRLPGPDGKLSNEYPDACADSLSTSESSESVGDYVYVSDFSLSFASESEVVLGELPYLETFNDGIADDWTVITGAFTLVEDPDSPTEPEEL